MKHEPEQPDAQGPAFSVSDIHGALRVLQGLQRAVEHNDASRNATPDRQRLVRLAKIIRKLRDGRVHLLPQGLLGEASWDILLALFIAEHEGYRMKVSDVCAQSGVPDTTGLRWLERLRELNLVCKRQHPLDRRVLYVEPTQAALSSVEAWLINALTEFETL